MTRPVVRVISIRLWARMARSESDARTGIVSPQFGPNGLVDRDAVQVVTLVYGNDG